MIMGKETISLLLLVSVMQMNGVIVDIKNVIQALQLLAGAEGQMMVLVTSVTIANRSAYVVTAKFPIWSHDC